MSFFGVNVNPFSTPVGQRIERATDGGLPSENWALNMEICDMVDETEDGARDAVKAIKRRLNQAASKNYTVVLYTLVVLETCVKNCGKRFHALVLSRDFVQELVKTIGPKNEPPAVVQEKVLSLIRTWAEAFRHEPHAQGVCQVYQELRTKGIQFPAAEPEAAPPIVTPRRSIPEAADPSSPSLSLGGGGPTAAAAAAAVAAAAAGTKEDPRSEQEGVPRRQRQGSATGGRLNESGSVGEAPNSLVTPLHEELVAKLRSELDVVQGNMRVLSEMLTYLTSPGEAATAVPGTESRKVEPADLELLEQLYETCKCMQERVVELIGRLVDDETTAELLEINDELNNLFLCYSRYTKNKAGGGGGGGGGQQPPSSGAAATPASAILARTIGQQQQQQYHQQQQQQTTEGGRSARNAEADSLIDLSDGVVDAFATRVSDIDIRGEGPAGTTTRGTTRGTTTPVSLRDKEHESDEFAVFAQSRNTGGSEGTKSGRTKYEESRGGVAEHPGKELVGASVGGVLSVNRAEPKSSPHRQPYASSGNGIALSNAPNPSRESEFNEMAAWLDDTPGDRGGDGESLTSSEFERFLAERAAAADALPSLPVVPWRSGAAAAPSPGVNVAASYAASTGTNIQRRINKDQDESLFAL